MKYGLYVLVGLFLGSSVSAFANPATITGRLMNHGSLVSGYQVILYNGNSVAEIYDLDLNVSGGHAQALLAVEKLQPNLNAMVQVSFDDQSVVEGQADSYGIPHKTLPIDFDTSISLVDTALAP